MDTSWRPVPGQVALIEYPDDDASTDHTACLTGLVLADHEGRVTVDLGASGPLAMGTTEILVSFFSPDALYRVRATARPGHPSAIIELDSVIDVERVQRRTSPRIPLQIPVVLTALDGARGGFPSVKGQTIDFGPGGLRVETERPFPDGEDPTVALALDDGRQLVAHTRVVLADVEDGRCEYRLAFADLSDEDLELINQVVEDFR